MCTMQLTNIRVFSVLLGYFVAQAKTYPMQGWPMYPQMPREYPDDEYYYAPKPQYYYDTPAISAPELHGQSAYPYYYDPYAHYMENEAPKDQEERLAALPIGQEMWFESDTPAHWQTTDDDDVSAAFLDNLILTQMAQDAQRRREISRAAFAPVDYEERDIEDEDVRELKALSGKPLYHVPKTVPRYEDEDYAADDGFINWNGNKRSFTTTTQAPSTTTPGAGQKEIMVPRPADTPRNNRNKEIKAKEFYNTLAQLLKNKSANLHPQDTANGRRIEKRFVAGDSDLVKELRGLKHHIAT